MAKKKSNNKSKPKGGIPVSKPVKDQSSLAGKNVATVDDVETNDDNHIEERTENENASDSDNDGSIREELCLDVDKLLKSLSQLKTQDPEEFNSMISRYIEPGDIDDGQDDKSHLVEVNKELEKKNDSLLAKLESVESQVAKISTLDREKEQQLADYKKQNQKFSIENQALKDELNNLKERKEEKNDFSTDISSVASENAHLKEALAASEAAKEEAEEQYQNLVGKISHIKSTLGERLKSDAEELASYRVTVQNLEATNRSLNETIETLQREVITATKDSDKLSTQLSALRSEFQDNLLKWENEKNNLIKEKRLAESQLLEAQASVRDLEIALSDDKSLNEGVNAKIGELEEQVTSQTNYAERFRSERDNLQKALSDMEQTLQQKKLEFSEKLAVLSSEAQNNQEKLDVKDKELCKLKSTVDELVVASKNSAQLEKELREKSLQIGKLRHEAVILNEHLTKALRMIKKDSEGETVDKQLITNLIVSFVAIPRGDTKKFEVLQLIANFLGWDEDIRVQAGLSRPSTNGGIGSPKRSFSSNSLADENAVSSGGFMGLFAEFLEKESTPH